MAVLGTLTPEQVADHLAGETMAELRRYVGIGELGAARGLLSAQSDAVLGGVAGRVNPPGLLFGLAMFAARHGWSVRQVPGLFDHAARRLSGLADSHSRTIIVGQFDGHPPEHAAAHELGHLLLHFRGQCLDEDANEREANAVAVRVMASFGSRARVPIDRLGGDAAADAACQEPRVRWAATKIVDYLAAEEQVRGLVAAERSARGLPADDVHERATSYTQSGRVSAFA